VKVGRDNGIRAEIVSGVQANDLIVAHPSEDLTSGAAVEFDPPTPAAEPTSATKS
jgi:hypothetical protein